MTTEPITPAVVRPPSGQVSEHLANERTYLAWVRTGISLISIGIAINKFSLALIDREIKMEPKADLPSAEHLLADSQNLGLMLILFGLLSVGMAAWRYTQTTQEIIEGTYRPSIRSVWVMTTAVLLIGGFCVYWLFKR